MKAKAFKVELRYQVNQNKQYDADELSVRVKNTIQRQLNSDIALDAFNSTTIDTIVYIVENNGASITAEVSIILDTEIHVALVERFVAKYLTSIPDDDYYSEDNRDSGITIMYYEINCA